MVRSRIQFSSIFAFAAILGLSSLAVGQENKGKILGTITDASGGVVPGVKVSATSESQAIPVVVTSDDSGRFVFEALVPGTYAVTASKEGFQTVKTANVGVRLGSQTDLNIRLSVGQLAQTVEVSEAAVSLDVTSSRTATNITVKEIDKLPTGRSFNSLLQLAPGVRQENKNGNSGVAGYQVDGASAAENSFVIDGVDVSDIRRGSLRLQNAIPPEFVQEIEIKSSGFEAQYGGAAGGVINVATRPGTNDFHGQILMQFQNDQMNPRPRGYYQRSPLNANVADFFAPRKDTYRNFWPGGVLSGPLVKNRIFFTTGYLPTYNRIERVNRYATGTRNYTQENINHYFLSRLDIAPTSKLQVNTSYFWTPQRQKGGALPTTDIRVAAPTNDLTVQGGWQPSAAYTASANYAFSSTFLVSARYGYKYQNDKLGNYGLSGAPYLTYQTASSASPIPVPAEFAGATGFHNVSNTFLVQKDITTRHNLYLDGSKIVNLAGQQHTFKFGYQLARVGNDVNSNYTNGAFSIYFGDSFSRGPINKAAGAYGYYIWEDGVRQNSAVNGRNQGIYLQDTWRVTRKLTINAGLRAENEFLPPYRAEQDGKKIANPISFGWTEKLAPRIGVAYDVLGDGKWKVSGSYGDYYDVMKYELARGSFGGDYWVSHVYKLDSPNVTSLSLTNPGVLGAAITQYDNRTVPINSKGEIDGIDPDIKPFKERRFNVEVAHQLASRLTASVRYTHTNLLKGIEDIGVLDPDGNEVYLIGNPGFGRTRNDLGDKTSPAHTYDAKTPNGKEYLVPEAKRTYDAVEMRLYGQVKRLNFIGSYTLSRLYGNWSGLANSDESGRQDPGVSRAFDLPYYYFDQSGSQKNVFGRLGTDRPHEFKAFFSYDQKWKFGTTTIGVNQSAFSGTNDTTTYIYLSAPTSPYGRGDLPRTPFYTQTDLSIAHNIKLNERASLRLEATALNALNQAVVVSRVSQLNRSGAITEDVLPLSKFFAGYDVKNYVAPGKTNAAYNAIYGLPGGSYRAGGTGAYQGPRDFRVGARITF